MCLERPPRPFLSPSVIVLLTKIFLSGGTFQEENNFHCAGSICKIVLNIQNVRQILESRSQKALLIYEVFRGQTTGKFLDALKENNVIATKVLPNTTEICEGFNQTKVQQVVLKTNQLWT